MASYLETSKRSFYSAILVVKEGLAKNCLALPLKEDHLSNKCLKKSDLTDCLKILSVPVYKIGAGDLRQTTIILKTFLVVFKIRNTDTKN